MARGNGVVMMSESERKRGEMEIKIGNLMPGEEAKIEV